MWQHKDWLSTKRLHQQEGAKDTKEYCIVQSKHLWFICHLSSIHKAFFPITPKAVTNWKPSMRWGHKGGWGGKEGGRGNIFYRRMSANACFRQSSSKMLKLLVERLVENRKITRSQVITPQRTSSSQKEINAPDNGAIRRGRSQPNGKLGTASNGTCRLRWRDAVGGTKHHLCVFLTETFTLVIITKKQVNSGAGLVTGLGSINGFHVTKNRGSGRDCCRLVELIRIRGTQNCMPCDKKFLTCSL